MLSEPKVVEFGEDYKVKVVDYGENYKVNGKQLYYKDITQMKG